MRHIITLRIIGVTILCIVGIVILLSGSVIWTKVSDYAYHISLRNNSISNIFDIELVDMKFNRFVKIKRGENYLMHFGVIYSKTCIVNRMDMIKRLGIIDPNDERTGESIYTEMIDRNDPRSKDISFVYSYPTITRMVSSNENYYENAIFHLPEWIPPGKYIHIKYSLAECGGLKTSNSPEIVGSFEVTE